MNKTPVLFKLGSYDVEEELGRGVFGRVYRATHRPTGTARALKVIEGTTDPEALLRFEREVETLARAGGEGVVPVHEAGTDRGRQYLVMGLMSGGSLRQRLKTVGRLEWRAAVELAAKLARALERCHAAGIIHRDLKPENVLFDDEARPRLADFGLVRDLQAATLTESGTLLGTPAYMAPEQLDGLKVDERADVYALGVLLHELVSGTRPFTAATVFAQLKEKSGKRPPLGTAGVPRALELLLDRTLAPRPEDRVPSAGELAARLESLLADPGKTAGPRSRLGLGLALGLALVVGVGAVVVNKRDGSPAPSPDPVASASGQPDSSGAGLAALLERVHARRIKDGDLLALATAPRGLDALDELASNAVVLSRSLVSPAVKSAWRTRGGESDLEVLEAMATLASAKETREWDSAFAHLAKKPSPTSTLAAFVVAGEAVRGLAKLWEDPRRKDDRDKLPDTALDALDAPPLGARLDLIRILTERLRGTCRSDLDSALGFALNSALSGVIQRVACIRRLEVLEVLAPEVLLSVMTYQHGAADLYVRVDQTEPALGLLWDRSRELEKGGDRLAAAHALALTLVLEANAEENERALAEIDRLVPTAETPLELELRHHATKVQAYNTAWLALRSKSRSELDRALDRWRHAIRAELVLHHWVDHFAKRAELSCILGMIDLALGSGARDDDLDEVSKPTKDLLDALQSGNAAEARRCAEIVSAEGDETWRWIGDAVQQGLLLKTEEAVLARREAPEDHVAAPNQYQPSWRWVAALATVRRLAPR